MQILKRACIALWKTQRSMSIRCSTVIQSVEVNILAVELLVQGSILMIAEAWLEMEIKERHRIITLKAVNLVASLAAVGSTSAFCPRYCRASLCSNGAPQTSASAPSAAARLLTVSALKTHSLMASDGCMKTSTLSAC